MPWSRSPTTAMPRAAEMQAELLAPETVKLTGRCDRLRPQVPWRSRWRWIRYVLLFLAPVLAVLILWLVSHYLHPR